MSGSDYTLPSEQEVEEFMQHSQGLLTVLRQLDYMSPDSFRNLAKSAQAKELIKTLAAKLTYINHTYL